MPETITYTQTLSASGGPIMTNTVTFSAEAYDKFSFTLGPESAEALDLTRSSVANIKAMYIRASAYGNILYARGEGYALTLTGPVMWVTNDILNIFPDWSTVAFINSHTTNPVTVEILFVRTAITPSGGD